MIILLACLGSFAAGVGVGFGIVWLYLESKAKKDFNKILEKMLDK